MRVLKTFKFYDSKERRLAVFCRELSDTSVEFFTLTCSKSEQFSKKFAKQKYDEFITTDKVENAKPFVETKKINFGDDLHKVMMNYCRKNYYTYELKPIEIYRVSLIKCDENSKIITL